MIEIQSIGGYATIQDRGRKGFLRFGVPRSGFMDETSAVEANKLLNNDPGAALIELFGGYLSISVSCNLCLSFTGATAQINVGKQSFLSTAIVAVNSGQIVTVGRLLRGCILYVGIKGGLNVRDVMGSRSTYVPASIGPNEGQPLKVGNIIEVNSSDASNSCSAVQKTASYFSKNMTITIYKGPEFDFLSESSQERFLNESFEISHINRTGYRLSANKLSTKKYESLTSRYVTRGTVQLPAGGDPIVLMSDAQTTGGYPRIGQLISSETNHFAQLKPGSRVRFRIKKTTF